MSISSDPLFSTSNNGPSEMSLHCFCNDEEILEALTTLEYPWDNMHHHSFFLHEELVSYSDQFSMETKNSIHGKVNWFKNLVTETNSYGSGYHNRHLDSRNQSFPICNRNQISNTKGSDLVPWTVEVDPRWAFWILLELTNHFLNNK